MKKEKFIKRCGKLDKPEWKEAQGYPVTIEGVTFYLEKDGYWSATEASTGLGTWRGYETRMMLIAKLEKPESIDAVKKALKKADQFVKDMKNYKTEVNKMKKTTTKKENKKINIDAIKKSFIGADNEDHLKAMYLHEAAALHPSNGGDVDTWDAINKAFSRRWSKVKGLHAYSNGQVYQDDITEKASDFIKLTDALMALDGLKVEQVGRFLWTGGKQAPHKKELSALGFKFQKNKNKWYKSYEGYEGHKDGTTIPYPQIKRTYGFIVRDNDEDTTAEI